jgi:hypothetical protein
VVYFGQNLSLREGEVSSEVSGFGEGLGERVEGGCGVVVGSGGVGKEVGGGFREGFVVCSGLRFSIRKI